jgi:predicted transcriptional regulator YheO
MTSGKKTNSGLGERAKRPKPDYLGGVLGRSGKETLDIESAVSGVSQMTDTESSADAEKKARLKSFRIEEELARRFAHYCINARITQVKALNQILADFLKGSGY